MRRHRGQRQQTPSAWIAEETEDGDILFQNVISGKKSFEPPKDIFAGPKLLLIPNKKRKKEREEEEEEKRKHLTGESAYNVPGFMSRPPPEPPCQEEWSVAEKTFVSKSQRSSKEREKCLNVKSQESGADLNTSTYKSCDVNEENKVKNHWILCENLKGFCFWKNVFTGEICWHRPKASPVSEKSQWKIIKKDDGIIYYHGSLSIPWKCTNKVVNTTMLPCLSISQPEDVIQFFDEHDRCFQEKER